MFISSCRRTWPIKSPSRDENFPSLGQAHIYKAKFYFLFFKSRLIVSDRDKFIFLKNNKYVPGQLIYVYFSIIEGNNTLKIKIYQKYIYYAFEIHIVYNITVYQTSTYIFVHLIILST